MITDQLVSMTKNTKESIIEAAKSLLIQGEISPSMSDIASKSQLSKSALYYFFKNKDDLFLAVMNSFFEDKFTGLELIVKKNIKAEKKLDMMTKHILAIHQENSDKNLSQFLFQQIFSHKPKMLKVIVEKRQIIIDLFTSVLNDMHRPDSHKSAEVIVGFLDFLVLYTLFPCPQKQKPTCDQHELASHLISFFKQ